MFLSGYLLIAALVSFMGTTANEELKMSRIMMKERLAVFRLRPTEFVLFKCVGIVAVCSLVLMSSLDVTSPRR